MCIRDRVKGKATPVGLYEPLGAQSEIDDAVRKNAADFEAAFAHYQAQQWEAAESILRALNARDPRRLYEIYLERIALFRDEPPAENWDGVFVYTTK